MTVGNQPRTPGDQTIVNNTRTRFILAPLAASALVFSLAACGSDDSSSSAGTTTVQTTDGPSDATTMTTDGDHMGGSEVTVGDITVADAWVRKPAEGQTTSAAYATIMNKGDADVTLTGAAVNVDATVEIHETVTDADGKMQMQERPDGFVIPAGGTFSLEPGGAHIMLIDVDTAALTGSIQLTLTFDDGTEVVIPAEVRDVAAGGMGDMTATTMAG